MVAGAFSRGQVWYHLNFWACCRKTKKIKRFFAEVHYKTAFSALTSHHRFKELRSHPAALAAALFTGTCHHQSQEKPPSSSSSTVCSDLPPPVRGDEKPPSSRSSVCLDLPPPVPGAEKPPVTSSVFSLLSPPVQGAEKPSSNSWHPIPIVETCTIHACHHQSKENSKSLLDGTGRPAHSVLVT
ncbi:hypothetical protein D1007_15522 [Hordeum vulgare]|nr:hypothetical protein D1007_15522 [Hordeum vulgare]